MALLCLSKRTGTIHHWRVVVSSQSKVKEATVTMKLFSVLFITFVWKNVTVYSVFMPRFVIDQLDKWTNDVVNSVQNMFNVAVVSHPHDKDKKEVELDYKGPENIQNFTIATEENITETFSENPMEENVTTIIEPDEDESLKGEETTSEPTLRDVYESSKSVEIAAAPPPPSDETYITDSLMMTEGSTGVPGGGTSLDEAATSDEKHFNYVAGVTEPDFIPNTDKITVNDGIFAGTGNRAKRGDSINSIEKYLKSNYWSFF